MRHQQQIFYRPCGQIILHEVIAGRTVAANGPHHGIIRAVSDGITDAGFLAFKLEPEFAFGTGKIAGLGVVRKPVQFG